VDGSIRHNCQFEGDTVRSRRAASEVAARFQKRSQFVAKK